MASEVGSEWAWMEKASSTRLRLTLPGLVLTALQACDPPTRAPQLLVTDSAGVEIVTLNHMPSLLDPDYEWGLHVEREFRTQGADFGSEPLLFDPSAVLPLRDGRLLVSDPLADQPLVLLDMDAGEVLARFGRKGRGPGELSGGWSMGEREDGQLWVANSGNRQVLSYSPGGELLSTHEFTPSRVLLNQAVQWRTSLLYGSIYTPPTRHVLRIDVGTGEQQTILDLPAETPEQIRTGVQQGRPLWTLLRSGIVTARSDVPVFRFYSHDGELIREIRLPLSMWTLTEMDIRRQIARYGDIGRSWEVGPIAITNALFAVDDSIFGMFQSSIWRAAEDPVIPEDQTVWRLISVTGEYLGFVRLPLGFFPLASGGGGVLWAKVPDANGVSIIREFVLQKPRALVSP